MAQTTISAIGGNIINKNKAIKRPIIVMEAALRTFISPITGKRKTAVPVQVE